MIRRARAFVVVAVALIVLPGGAAAQVVTGEIYEDRNANGMREAGEPALSGVSVRLFGTGVGSVDLTTSSAADGSFGFSPGDGSYDQPYFYVTPWPYPEAANLPSLAEGAEWHRSGWTGAVFTAERLLSVPPAEQEHSARKALERAVSASRELLGT